MACPVMVDLRNVYRPEDVKKYGFSYTSVGRTPTHRPVPPLTGARYMTTRESTGA